MIQDALASYDFVWYDYDPTPDVNYDEPNRHGTSCAGEVAMGKNHTCGVGVAYGCNIGGITGLLLKLYSENHLVNCITFLFLHFHSYSSDRSVWTSLYTPYYVCTVMMLRDSVSCSSF